MGIKKLRIELWRKYPLEKQDFNKISLNYACLIQSYRRGIVFEATNIDLKKKDYLKLSVSHFTDLYGRIYIFYVAILKFSR
jgi:hypothetical protein